MGTSGYREGDGLTERVRALGFREPGSGKKLLLGRMLKDFRTISAADVYESALLCLNEYMFSSEAKARLQSLNFEPFMKGQGKGINIPTYAAILWAR